MGMKALGRLFDVGIGLAPVDINTNNAETGMRISMSGHSGLTVIAITLVGGAEDLIFDVQQATAYTGGTSNDMDSTNGAIGVTEYYIKAETALDNDESWVKVTQAEQSEVTVAGATYGTQQKLVAFYVGADQLADGYTHISVNVSNPATATSQILAVLYFPHDLLSQRAPANLPNLLNPGAANV